MFAFVTALSLCMNFSYSSNAFASLSLLYDLPFNRDNEVTYTQVIATQDEQGNHFAYYDVPVMGSVPDAVRYGFSWGISIGCNAPDCISPGFHLYVVNCDVDNKNCTDGFDSGYTPQIATSTLPPPACWDNDHVITTKPILWNHSYTDLCGVGDVTSGTFFPANYPQSNAQTTNKNKDREL